MTLLLMTVILVTVRAQVKYKAAKEYSEAAMAAASRTGVSAADRAYQEMLQASACLTAAALLHCTPAEHTHEERSVCL